jgi:hypothetical protein
MLRRPIRRSELSDFDVEAGRSARRLTSQRPKSTVGAMERLVVICALVAMFAHCKRDTSAAITNCKEGCDRKERQSAAIRKDIDFADRAATEIERMNGATDAEAQRDGVRALQVCDQIRTTFAHARGIAWAFDWAFDEIEKVGATCHGDEMRHALPLSPAQLKTKLVGDVHAMKGKYAANDACAASCDQAK